MRTFNVWCGNEEREVEMPDDASDQECEAQCESEIDYLIERMSKGWDETTERGLGKLTEVDPRRIIPMKESK